MFCLPLLLLLLPPFSQYGDDDYFYIDIYRRSDPDAPKFTLGEYFDKLLNEMQVGVVDSGTLTHMFVRSLLLLTLLTRTAPPDSH